MSWFKERKKWTYCQRFCANILKSGHIPKHVAVIMDGNRRFAAKEHMQRIEGHIKGFEKLSELLGWCLELAITEVTVYAFSIENYSRDPDEVDGLMALAREKFGKLLEEKDEIDKNGVCIRIFGDLSLLPPDIQKLVADVTLMTQNNKSVCLNICFSYTSREEMCQSVRQLVEGVKQGAIQNSDVTEDAISKCLYTGLSDHPQPDLLIRTSGEVRLSDFLLWQSSYSPISFIPILWPEVTVWHLFGAILTFQLSYNEIEKWRSKHIKWKNEEDKKLDEESVASDSAGHGNGVLGSKDRQVAAQHRRREREKRVNAYVADQNANRMAHLVAIGSKNL